MLTLLGIILIHQNGLKWCKTLDIALLGNWGPDTPGRPRYVTSELTVAQDELVIT
jgi:hypothetical protein